MFTQKKRQAREPPAPDFEALNIKETSELFGIGQHRLREIVHDDYENKYHLMLGRTIKIKRKQFKEYIEQVEQI